MTNSDKKCYQVVNFNGAHYCLGKHVETVKMTKDSHFSQRAMIDLTFEEKICGCLQGGHPRCYYK
jgi:alkylhydroperoxidase family enzyme